MENPERRRGQRDGFVGGIVGAVGEVGFVLAAERNLTLLHGDSHLGLVRGVVVMGTAGVHPSVLIFRHCNC